MGFFWEIYGKITGNVWEIDGKFMEKLEMIGK